jgi:hypothetical protein
LRSLETAANTGGKNDNGNGLTGSVVGEQHGNNRKRRVFGQLNKV